MIGKDPGGYKGFRGTPTFMYGYGLYRNLSPAGRIESFVGACRLKYRNIIRLIN